MIESTLPRIIDDSNAIAGYGFSLSNVVGQNSEIAPTIKQLSFHPDDLGIVINYYQNQIATAQDNALAYVIQASPTRTTVYILKYLELLALELGVRTTDQLPILSQESQADGFDQSSLLAAWTKNREAWVYLIGRIEAAGTTAKHRISQAKDDVEMRTIVDGFISSLKELSSGD